MNILFITSEAVPFMATGGLADVAGALPKALCQNGEDCRVVMPLYGGISPEMRQNLHFIGKFNVPLSWRNQYCGIFMGEVNGVVYYLVDNEYYFKRPEPYGHFDEAERFSFFSKAVLEMLSYIDFHPDILHCNDWQSAMVPAYLQIFYKDLPQYQKLRTVFTIHNIGYQGQFSSEIIDDVLGVPKKSCGLIEFEGCVNFMKAAIESSDAITTVSPTYAQEILDPWHSHGLDALLWANQEKLSGILNGIDTESYDPQTDPALYENYSATDFAAKAVDKAKLQEECGLVQNPEQMLLGMVTRLTAHKGIDLVKCVLEEILDQGIAVVILGSGDFNYENYFRDAAQRHPGQLAFVQGFIPSLARRIYAGADVFLMPSKEEPCGLAQMVSLRYGTLPIVRRTGGLCDTIMDVGDGKGNGYTFQSYNAHHMLDSIKRAYVDYHDRKGWKEKIGRAMACNFSWDRPAKEYQKLYSSLLGR